MNTEFKKVNLMQQKQQKNKAILCQNGRVVNVPRKL